MKYIAVLISIFIGLFIVVCGWNIQNSKDKNSSNASEMSTENKVYYADEEIKQIIESQEYKDAALDERETMIRQLLSQLEKEGMIKHYTFSKESHMFSFEYSDGTLGGVLIEDHNPEFNAGEPMN